MALRVLLADNSETIKKVIQLTLQDFAVDLRIVASGIDVIDAVEKFKPDIIFVDILLQKKDGYEVSRELKQHPTLGSLPVILMWSGFMEFDEERAKYSLADARLEKPFDAKTLRDLVIKFVSKTKSNALGSFLDFPDLPPSSEQTQTSRSKSKDPLEDLQKIQQESLKFANDLKKSTKADISSPSESIMPIDLELGDSDEEFEMQPLEAPSSKLNNASLNSDAFKLDIPEELTDGDDFSVNIDNIDKVDDMSFLLNPDVTGKEHTNPNKKATPDISNQEAATQKTDKKQEGMSQSTQTINYNQEDIEKIVNQRVQDVIEKVVWQVVPEMASQMVRKELERLLKEKDT